MNNQTPISLDTSSNLYIFQCPSCSDFVQVERGAVACSIFRHLYYANINGNRIELLSQVDAHAPKEICERLLREGRAVGCGKPFKMIVVGNDQFGNPTYRVEICDYI
jgi:hypothetical protein